GRPWRPGCGPTRCRSPPPTWKVHAVPRRPSARSAPGTGTRTSATAWRRPAPPTRRPRRHATRPRGNGSLDVGDQDAGDVEVRDGGGAADHVGGDLERVVHRGGRGEAEPAHRGRVAADDDHPAGVLLAVGAPVPRVE